MGEHEVDSLEDEYTKLIRRMKKPRVVIDNAACDNETVIQVHSVNRHGILLKVIQVLSDLNLGVTKAYISSDGEWFMNVFNVVDREGNKIWDKEIIHYIIETIETDACIPPSPREEIESPHSKAYTSIELTGTDRTGLLSEVCAVLADLMCNVVKAEVWTHNNRIAAIIHVTEASTGFAVEDPRKLLAIKELLCNVLKGGDCFRRGRMRVGIGMTHTERRLHQLMFDDRDYEGFGKNGRDNGSDSSRPHVVLLDCFERDYTIAILKSKDRPKLLFDTVCTLTDMQYVVFHGMVDTSTEEAYQEYYIRHIDGVPINSEGERQRVIQCLEAAIERRASEGLQLELRTKDRMGLLSEITQVFRENGLKIQMAKISTQGDEVVDTFCVSDMTGSCIDSKTIDSIKNQIGQADLRVKHNPQPPKDSSADTPGFLLGSILKVCSFHHHFRLIRSCS